MSGLDLSSILRYKRKKAKYVTRVKTSFIIRFVWLSIQIENIIENRPRSYIKIYRWQYKRVKRIEFQNIPIRGRIKWT